jgi:chemotaxis protein CheY-P-specific phosphatase CheC
MMKDLTPQEIDVARKIISAGLVKSAESLSFFMNETISLKDFDAEKNLDNPPLELGKKDESNIHLLTTKVIGEMKGICCLIFSEEEADHLRKAALPQEILDSPEMMEEMSDGIMLEVDNIISASVITQFSNLLKVKIHGGVPDLKKVTFKEMEDYISSEVNNELYLISFKTSFESSKAQFNPEFVWLFDNTFIDNIKKYAALEV